MRLHYLIFLLLLTGAVNAESEPVTASKRIAVESFFTVIRDEQVRFRTCRSCKEQRATVTPATRIRLPRGMIAIPLMSRPATVVYRESDNTAVHIKFQ